MASTQPAVAVIDDALRDAMLRDRLLIATGVPGVYGLGAAFEDTLLRIARLIGRSAADDHAELVRFPPILNRRHFAQSGYLASFPHLAGTVHSFEGTDRVHSELLRAVAQGQDWSAAFPATDVVLTPAACYPVYPLLAGRLPAPGRLFDGTGFQGGPMADMQYHDKTACVTVKRIQNWKMVSPKRLRFEVVYVGDDGEEQSVRRHELVRQPKGGWLFTR